MNTSKNIYPNIQGLRAIAVLLVLIFHAGLPLPGGFLGVDIFFMISGYVITLSLLRKVSSQGKISLPKFYARRIRRLTPALTVVVVTTCLLSFLLESPFNAQEVTAKTALSAIFGISNFTISHISGDYFAENSENNPLLHTWSLAVEEQFYIFFPIWIVAGLSLFKDRLKHYIFISGIAVTVFSFMLALPEISAALDLPAERFWGGYYGPVTRIWEFMVGTLLACGSIKLKSKAIPHLSLIGITLIAIMGSNENIPIITLLAILTACPLLILSQEYTPSYLESKPILFIGNISYSLYLWHWPLVTYSKILFPLSTTAPIIATLISFLPAWLSYKYIEQPIIRKKPIDYRIFFNLWPKLLIPSIAIISFLFVGQGSNWWLDWDKTKEFNRSQVNDISNCMMHLDAKNCISDNRISENSILIIGDSQAASLVPALRNQSAEIYVSSAPGCPALTRESTEYKKFSCENYQRNFQSLVKDNSFKAVILSNRSIGYTTQSLGWRTLTENSVAAENDASSLRIYKESLEEVVSIINPKTQRVLITSNISEPEFLDQRQSLFRKLFPPELPDSFNINSQENSRKHIDTIHQEISQDNDRVRLIQLTNANCNDAGKCLYEVDGESVYLDKEHLNDYGASLLSDQFDSALQ